MSRTVIEIVAGVVPVNVLGIIEIGISRSLNGAFAFCLVILNVRLVIEVFDRVVR
jgi:hypothetical protein